MTEKDISLMSTGDMRLIYNHNSMFYYSTPPVEIPYYICQVSFCVVYISSEGVYASMQYVDNNSWGTGKFGTLPENIEGAGMLCLVRRSRLSFVSMLKTDVF